MIQKIIDTLSFRLQILGFTGLVILGLILGGILVDRTGWQLDLTKVKRFTLSSQSKKVVEKLASPIRFTAFFRDKSFDGEQVALLLDAYRQHNRLIQYQMIDPERNPLKAQQYDVAEYGTVVIEYEEKRKDVGIEQIFGFSEADAGESFDGESTFTNAMFALMSQTVPRVYFLTGHKERQLDSDEQDGLLRLQNLLFRENLEAEPLNLASSPIPEDAGCLIIAGPKRPMDPPEIQAILRYVQSGRPVVVMADPFDNHQINDIISGVGLRFVGEVVVDEESAYFFDSVSVVPVYTDHPITQPLRRFEIGAVLPVSGYLEEIPRDSSRYIIHPLLSTSPGAWAETTLRRNHLTFSPGRDELGPFMLGAIVNEADTQGDSQPRMAVFSDADFVTNGYIGIQGNLDLFVNTLRYLMQDSDQIAIRPKTENLSNLNISDIELRIVFITVVFLIPLLCLGAGSWVLWKRRQANRN